MKQFEKLDLLICDEWGYVPIDSDGSKLLFGIISECYERKSLIITTNLEFARWNDIFADTKIIKKVGKRCFYPSPKVDSALVKFKINKTPRVKITPNLKQTIKAAFSMRRKNIKN